MTQKFVDVPTINANTCLCLEEEEISPESRSISAFRFPLPSRASPPRSRIVSHALLTRISRRSAGGGRREERGEGGRAHTLRASPLPVYVRALHPATLRPPARAIVPDTVSTVIVTRGRALTELMGKCRATR